MGITRREASQYLAAMLDGEGTICGHEGEHRPMLSISNTEESLIVAIKECLDKLGIEYRVHYRQPSNKNHSRLTTVVVAKREALIKFEKLVPLRSEAKRKRLRMCNERPRFLFEHERPIKEIKQKRREKKSWRKVGEELGLSAFSVHQWAKQAGIPTEVYL